MTKNIESVNDLKLRELIKKIVKTYKKFSSKKGTIEHLEVVQKLNGILLKQFNCEFMKSVDYYYNHNTEKYVNVK